MRGRRNLTDEKKKPSQSRASLLRALGLALLKRCLLRCAAGGNAADSGECTSLLMRAASGARTPTPKEHPRHAPHRISCQCASLLLYRLRCASDDDRCRTAPAASDSLGIRRRGWPSRSRPSARRARPPRGGLSASGLRAGSPCGPTWAPLIPRRRRSWSRARRGRCRAAGGARSTPERWPPCGRSCARRAPSLSRA